MIQFDSRQVKKGDIFVAIKGQNFDGNDFIEEAIKKGAKLVYGEKKFKNPKYIRVVDARKKLGELCREYYKDPSSKLKVIGVTGTKGKTTTCHLIHHILVNNGKKAGIISTISSDGLHTTSPDIVTLNKYLVEMLKKGIEYVVLEVSSHGIAQQRIAGIKFDISVLTNIKPEHLDYHKTFNEYKKVKMMFINSARYRVFSPTSTRLNILKGEFNNLNAEAAIAVAQELGISTDKAIKSLKSFKLPSGRLEEIENDKGIKVIVDFAHTKDSLEVSLKYLKSITKRNLISVFGCAGLRDTKKRAKMGLVSTQLADLSIFTAEDPRTENVFDIIKKIKSKAIKDKYITIPERGEAIAYALSIAKSGDTVGIFGKGHEKSMCYINFEHPWSDQDFIKNLLTGYQDVAGVVLAAGKGTRMKSKLPKVIHTICGRPMIAYSLENLRNAGLFNLLPVVGYKRNLVLREISRHCNYVVQNKTSGTGDALKIALNTIDPKIKNVLVANGDDSAFYKPSTIKNVINTHIKNNAMVTFVSLIQDNPFGLGRVLRNKKGDFEAIIEEKDATEDQKKVNEVNDGLYIFDQKWLRKNIVNLQKSPVTGEYYLTDLLKIAVGQQKRICIYKLPDSSEWQGINTPEQLQLAEDKMIKRLEYELKSK